QGDFADVDAERIGTGIHSIQVEGVPLQKVSRPRLLDSGEFGDGRLAGKRNFYVVPLGDAQRQISIRRNSTIGDSDLYFVGEIRLQGDEVKPLQLHLEIRGEWIQADRPIHGERTGLV